MRGLIFAFVLGAALLQTQAALPDLRLAWGLLPLAFALIGFGRGLGWSRGPGRIRLLFLLLGACAAGFFYAAWRADLRLAESLTPHWEGREVVLHGRVLGLPETMPRGQRFLFERASGGQADWPRRLLLDWSARLGETIPATLRGGDCVQLGARLFRPHGSLNPGGFDYEGWLLERGVRATGYVLRAPVSAAECPAAARAGLDSLREAVRERVRQVLADASHIGIAVALVVGDQNSIPSAQWTLFRTTGVTHLMSISGLHVTLLSGLVFLLTQAVWRRLPPLATRVPARVAAALAGLFAAAAYVAIAGFGIPAQRTLYMLAVVALALVFGRLGSPSRTLAAALCLVVLIDPWAALAPGFWLSFGAVAAMFFAAAGRLRPAPVWLEWTRTQWAVSFALLPALLIWFHEASLVSPLANALAIPLISVLAVPALLAGALSWLDWPLHLGHAVIEMTVFALDALAALPKPVFHAAAPGWPALALAGAGIIVLLLPRGVSARWLGAVLLLPLLFPRIETPAPGDWRLTLLDVGQGVAVLVRTARHTLLYDSGPRYASGEDAGRRVVAPYLHGQGIHRLDALLISHDDADHSGGALSLIASHTPERVLSSAAGLPETGRDGDGQALLKARPDAEACAAGQTWIWDAVRFEILHPPAHHYANPNFSDNDRSCVLRVVGRHGSALLTGDIARLAELTLVDTVAANAVRADFMLVPHHGSRSSSMPEVLARVAPRWALFSVGRRNAHGHPAPEVLARYRALGAEILRTDRDGAIDIHTGAEGPLIERARLGARRYWHGR